MNTKLTYQDIAKIWQVSARTVRRWIATLERRRLIRPLRLTCGTVRLMAADLRLLENARKVSLDGVIAVRRCPQSG